MPIIEYSVRFRSHADPNVRIQRPGCIHTLNLEAEPFDSALLIYFNQDFALRAAYKVSHAAAIELARYSERQAGHVLRLTKKLLADSRCVDVTPALRAPEVRFHEEATSGT
ncbi:MAG TPA: hypothetical protein VJL28_12200 [Gemmatimonadaceae bacterium]|nr:hypothetical protein [Gemmatimonadaceae bacterium]